MSQHVRGTVQVRIECDEVGPSKWVRRIRFNGRLGVHDSRFGTALALLVIRSEHVQLSRFGVLAQSRFQQGFDHGVQARVDRSDLQVLYQDFAFLLDEHTLGSKGNQECFLCSGDVIEGCV